VVKRVRAGYIRFGQKLGQFRLDNKITKTNIQEASAITGKIEGAQKEVEGLAEGVYNPEVSDSSFLHVLCVQNLGFCLQRTGYGNFANDGSRWSAFVHVSL